MIFRFPWNHPEAWRIFFLFLSCVWEFLNCIPKVFEFTEPFLVEIMDSIIDGRFSNFADPQTLKPDRTFTFPPSDLDLVLDKMASAWDYFLMPKIFKKFLNPLYQPVPNLKGLIINKLNTSFWYDPSTPSSKIFFSISCDSQNNLFPLGPHI